MDVRLTEANFKRLVIKSKYYKSQAQQKDIIIKALNDQIEKSNNFINSLKEKED
jgi:hypothetical protein